MIHLQVKFQLIEFELFQSGTLLLCFLLPEKLLVVYLLCGESDSLPLLLGVPCVLDEPLDPRSYSQTVPKAFLR